VLHDFVIREETASEAQPGDDNDRVAPTIYLTPHIIPAVSAQLRLI